MGAVHPRGVTLLEMLVVLSLMGIIGAVTALQLSSVPHSTSSRWVQAAARARGEAIRSGVPVSLADSTSPGHSVLFLPDGRAIGNDVDPLTGELFFEAH